MTTSTKIRLVALGNLWLALTLLAAYTALGWWLYQHIASLFWLSLVLILLAATLCTLVHGLWVGYKTVVRNIVAAERLRALLNAWAKDCPCPKCTAKREAAQAQSGSTEA